jgi:peroxiredoxin family protein
VDIKREKNKLKKNNSKNKKKKKLNFFKKIKNNLEARIIDKKMASKVFPLHRIDSKSDNFSDILKSDCTPR